MGEYAEKILEVRCQQLEQAIITLSEENKELKEENTKLKEED